MINDKSNKITKSKTNKLQKYCAGTPELMTFGTWLDTNNHCVYICFMNSFQTNMHLNTLAQTSYFESVCAWEEGQTDLEF